MAKKEFVQPVADVRFPYTNFVKPDVDDSAATSLKAAATIGQDVMETYQDNKFVGEDAPEANNVSMGGVELPRGQRLDDQSAIKLSQQDDELNLRKIKRMREQGIISADAAKLITSQAVQSASARTPGRASEFRKQAATFFGDFGEGMDLLQPSAGERQQSDLKAALVKQAATHGFIDGFDAAGKPMISDDTLQKYLGLVNKNQMYEFENKHIETQFNRGKVMASELDAYARNISHSAAMEAMGAIQAKLVSGDGAVMRPEVLDNMIGMSKQRALSRVEQASRQRRADGTGPLMTSEQIQSIKKTIDTYFEEQSRLVKSQSFGAIMKDRKEGLQSYLAISGASAMPTLAALEAAAPGSGKYMIDLMPKLMNMNEQQRSALFMVDPVSKHFWDSAIASQHIMKGVVNVTRGMLPDKSTFPSEYNAALIAGTQMAMDNSSDSAAAKTQGVAALVQASNKGDNSAMQALADPSVKQNMSTQDKTKLIQVIASRMAAVAGYPTESGNIGGLADALNKELGNNTAENAQSPVRVGGKGWKIQPGYQGAGGLVQFKLVPDGNAITTTPSKDLQQMIASLNTTAKLLHTYQAEPEFDKVIKASGARNGMEYMVKFVDEQVKAAPKLEQIRAKQKENADTAKKNESEKKKEKGEFQPFEIPTDGSGLPPIGAIN